MCERNYSDIIWHMSHELLDSPSVEKIAQGTIDRLAEEIGTFYELPQDIIVRGKDTKGYIVPPEIILAVMEQYVKEVRKYALITPIQEAVERDLGIEIPNHQRAHKRTSLRTLKRTVAISLVTHSEKRLLLIKSGFDLSSHESILLHELFHQLSAEGFGLRNGLQAGPYFSGLNDAAIEILRLKMQFTRTLGSNVTLSDLLYLLNQKQYPIPYEMETLTLLATIKLTNMNRSELTEHQLIDYVFGINSGKGTSPVDFMNLVGAKVDKGKFEAVAKTFLNILQ